MAPINPLWEMTEGTELHLVYVDCVLKDWPALREMTEADRQLMYMAIGLCLGALDTRVEAIRASASAMRLIVKLSENLCIDDMLNAIDAASQSAVPHLVRAGVEWIGSSSVETISPTRVAAVIAKINGKPPREES